MLVKFLAYLPHFKADWKNVFLASPDVTFVPHQSCNDFYLFSLPKCPFLTFSPDQSAHPYFKWQSGINPPQEPSGLCTMGSGVGACLNLCPWGWGGRALSKCHCSGREWKCLWDVSLPAFVKGVLCVSMKKHRQRLNKVHKIFNSSVIPVWNQDLRQITQLGYCARSQT